MKNPKRIIDNNRRNKTGRCPDMDLYNSSLQKRGRRNKGKIRQARKYKTDTESDRRAPRTGDS